MDLALFFRVLWRFKFVVIGGVLLAAALAVFSTAKIDKHGVRLRSDEQWLSYSRLFVTQSGFPWGALGAQQASATGGTSTSSTVPLPQYADPNRLTSLATIYSQLATSDPVQQLVRRQRPRIDGLVQVAPVLAAPNNNPLPLISIAAFAKSPGEAMTLARQEANALVSFVTQQQTRNEIATKNRVVLQLVQEPTVPTLAKKRSYTLPIVVFLALLIATCIVACVLENLFPRGGRTAGEKNEQRDSKTFGAAITGEPAPILMAALDTPSHVESAGSEQQLGLGTR